MHSVDMHIVFHTARDESNFICKYGFLEVALTRVANSLYRLVLFGVFQSMFRRPLVLRNLCDERFLDQTSLGNAAYGPFPLETCHAHEPTKSSGKPCYRNLLNSAFSETSLAIESFISGNTCRVEQWEC